MEWALAILSIVCTGLLGFLTWVANNVVKIKITLGEMAKDIGSLTEQRKELTDKLTEHNNKIMAIQMQIALLQNSSNGTHNTFNG